MAAIGMIACNLTEIMRIFYIKISKFAIRVIYQKSFTHQPVTDESERSRGETTVTQRDLFAFGFTYTLFSSDDNWSDPI